MDTEQAAGGGGKAFHEVLDILHARLTEGRYKVGSRLPPQRELAKELGVSRDTVQRVLRQLANDGWIKAKQGSGSVVLRSQTIHSSVRREGASRPVTLGPLIGEAFEASEVALDVFTLTSESLDTHVRAQEERIRTGDIRPQSITIRMMLPPDDLVLPYPRVKDAPDDQRPQQRLWRIRQRHIDSLREVLGRLEEEMPDLETAVNIRRAPLVPYSKLYLFNHAAMLHGPYEPEERRMTLGDGEVVNVIDVRGVGSTLTHYVKDEDRTSQGSVMVESWQSWFDQCWRMLAK